MAIERLKTVYFLGSLINNVKGMFSKINEIVNYLNTYSSNIEATNYTEYRALISQTGTNAPVEDDLDGSGAGAAFVDTLGGAWSYNDVGSFYYTKTGAFADVTKVEIIFGENRAQQSPKVSVKAVVVNDNTIEVGSGEFAGFTNPSVITPGNGKLYLQPIIIRVYA